jgi:hypothetical protein
MYSKTRSSIGIKLEPTVQRTKVKKHGYQIGNQGKTNQHIKM